MSHFIITYFFFWSVRTFGRYWLLSIDIYSSHSSHRKCVYIIIYYRLYDLRTGCYVFFFVERIKICRSMKTMQWFHVCSLFATIIVFVFSVGSVKAVFLFHSLFSFFWNVLWRVCKRNERRLEHQHISSIYVHALQILHSFAYLMHGYTLLFVVWCMLRFQLVEKCVWCCAMPHSVCSFKNALKMMKRVCVSVIHSKWNRHTQTHSFIHSLRLVKK